MRAGTQPPPGTRDGSQRDQLPATAGPSLRVGVDGRSQSAPGGRGSSSGTLDPGRAPAARRCPRPRRKRAESRRAAPIGPRLPLGKIPAAGASPRRPRARRSSPSVPYPPGCAARAPGRRPAGRHSPLTLLAVAFWRLPFGGDVPQPTSGERRPADHPRQGARTWQATPPSVACHAETPPSREPRPFQKGAWPSFRIPNLSELLPGEGGALCSGLGRGGVVLVRACTSLPTPTPALTLRGRRRILPAKEAA